MSFMNPESSGDDPCSGRPNDTRKSCPSGCNCFSEEFCAALEGNFIPQYIIDPDTFVVCYCNQALRNVLKKDIKGSLCYKEMRGHNAPCEDCPAVRYYQTHDTTPKLVQNQLGFWQMVYTSPVQWHERTFILLTCVDIDRQKKLENELELRDQEYSAIVRQSITGVMRYDLATDAAAVNVDINLNRVDEYTISDYTRKVIKSRMIAPDSVEVARRIMRDVHDGAPSREYDVQLILPQRGPRWCHVDYMPIPDGNGAPYRAVFSFFDNTDQHEKEQAHKNWNNRLEALMKKYTAYMEVNLTQDRIVSEGRSGSWHQDLGGRRFSDFVVQMCKLGILKEDRLRFESFSIVSG